jgi:hypothetical protein
LRSTPSEGILATGSGIVRNKVDPVDANRLKRPVGHDDLLNFRLERLLTLGAAPAIRLCEGRYGVARARDPRHGR